MTDLEALREKISAGVRAWYKTPEGLAHRTRLADAMRKKWERLHKGEEALGR